MTETSIEWTDKTWNPVRGCALVSPGCTNCYAMKQAHRFSNAAEIGPSGTIVDGRAAGPYAGLTVLTKKHGPRWTGTARFVPEMLDAPLRWRKPARVFVNSMSDLFHDDVTNEQIAAVFGVMAACPLHTFQILTKRPERMLAWCTWAMTKARDFSMGIVEFLVTHSDRERSGTIDTRVPVSRIRFPLPNVWLGVSAEDQQRLDERLPLLKKTPAAVRFLSCEPLLGPLDFRQHWVRDLDGTEWENTPATDRSTELEYRIDWVIVGGESGPGSRACDVKWIRGIVEQCKDAGVAVFVKQLGRTVVENRGRDEERVGGPDHTHVFAARITDDGTVERKWHPTDRKGGLMAEWPEDLRVREMPL